MKMARIVLHQLGPVLMKQLIWIVQIHAQRRVDVFCPVDILIRTRLVQALFVQVGQELLVPLFYKRSSVWSADNISYGLAMAIIDNEAVLGLQQVVGTTPGMRCDVEDFGPGVSERFIGCHRELGLSAQW